jgi:hypothetical protein
MAIIASRHGFRPRCSPWRTSARARFTIPAKAWAPSRSQRAVGVRATGADLIPRFPGQKPLDFLKTTKSHDSIVFNPPFRVDGKQTIDGFDAISREARHYCLSGNNAIRQIRRPAHQAH